MNRITTLLLGAGLVLTLNETRAQVPAAVQQVDSVQHRRQLEQTAEAAESGEVAPELFAGEASDAGAQSILKFKPRKTHFEAMADVQYFYTDNMFLAEDDPQDADVLVSTVQFALAPTAYALGGGQFAPRLGYRQEWYNFGLASDKEVEVYDFASASLRSAPLSEFDFSAQTIFAGGQWRCGNWIVDAGVDFQRLMDTDHYDEFYREVVPRWGVQRLFPLGERSTLAIGYAGDYRFTDTDLPPPTLGDDFNDRTDHSVFVTYTLALSRKVLVQPYYRYQYTHFTADEDRDDNLNSFGLALYCFFTPWISARAFAGYDIMNTTSTRVPDYNQFDGGGGVNVTIRF